MKRVFIIGVLLIFAQCKDNKKSEETASGRSSVEIGMEYAKGTQAVLAGNLKKAIAEKGTAEALKFCSTEALPLTDSMAMVYGAKIRRVTDKPRNPANLANEEELTYIEDFKRALASGEQLDPIIKTKSGMVDFYYPIITNALCLQCHGKPNKEIQPYVLTALSDLYLQDKAFGYEVDQVRGIWSISYNEERE
jgi:hypothetical protein